MSEDFGIKIAVMGSANVGKTSILKQYLTGCFSPTDVLPSYHMAYQFHTEEYESPFSEPPVSVRLQLTDFSGTEHYWKEAAAIVIVFDVTNRDSFNSLIQQIACIKAHGIPSLGIFLVANKCDLEKRCVSIREIAHLAKHDLLQGKDGEVGYFELAATDGDAVRSMFRSIGYHCIKKFSNDPLLVNEEMTGVSVAEKMKDSLENSTLSLIEYISMREEEGPIPFGKFSLQEKTDAVRYINHIIFMSDRNSQHALTKKAIDLLRQFYRGPLCDGRLRVSFERTLFPKLGVTQLIKSEIALNQLRLEFALGVLEQYMESRASRLEALYFFVSEQIRAIAGEQSMRVLKLNACRDIKRALNGELDIDRVLEDHQNAFEDENDRLTMLVRMLKKYDCFTLYRKIPEFNDIAPTSRAPR